MFLEEGVMMALGAYIEMSVTDFTFTIEPSFDIYLLGTNPGRLSFKNLAPFGVPEETKHAQYTVSFTRGLHYVESLAAVIAWLAGHAEISPAQLGLRFETDVEQDNLLERAVLIAELVYRDYQLVYDTTVAEMTVAGETREHKELQRCKESMTTAIFMIEKYPDMAANRQEELDKLNEKASAIETNLVTRVEASEAALVKLARERKKLDRAFRAARIREELRAPQLDRSSIRI